MLRITTREGQAVRRRGFSLIELLVVIFVIAILIALLLPAVQAAREAARQTRCRANLRQVALACVLHEERQGFLPSCGWGHNWVGDSDRGFGRRQPGGWIFNILPTLEQQALHDLGRGSPPEDKRCAAGVVVGTPVSVPNCPSRPRRVPALYTVGDPQPHRNAQDVPLHARADYAGNAGDDEIPMGFGEVHSEREGEDPTWSGWPKWMATQTGVISLQSMIRLVDVEDGAAHTYLVAEKHVAAAHYDTGDDAGDDMSMYQGFDRDVLRWGTLGAVPVPDQSPMSEWEASTRFGSAHTAGFHATLVDGSVRFLSYSIEPSIHARLANRQDGLTLPEGTW